MNYQEQEKLPSAGWRYSFLDQIRALPFSLEKYGLIPYATMGDLYRSFIPDLEDTVRLHGPNHIKAIALHIGTPNTLKSSTDKEAIKPLLTEAGQRLKLGNPYHIDWDDLIYMMADEGLIEIKPGMTPDDATLEKVNDMFMTILTGTAAARGANVINRRLIYGIASGAINRRTLFPLGTLNKPKVLKTRRLLGGAVEKLFTGYLNGEFGSDHFEFAITETVSDPEAFLRALYRDDLKSIPRPNYADDNDIIRAIDRANITQIGFGREHRLFTKWSQVEDASRGASMRATLFTILSSAALGLRLRPNSLSPSYQGIMESRKMLPDKYQERVDFVSEVAGLKPRWMNTLDYLVLDTVRLALDELGFNYGHHESRFISVDQEEERKRLYKHVGIFQPFVGINPDPLYVQAITPRILAKTIPGVREDFAKAGVTIDPFGIFGVPFDDYLLKPRVAR